MFSKKYVFETKSTRAKRLLRDVSLVFLALLTLFTLICVYIPTFASQQNNITKEALFLKAPDVIAVFTGDAGRIDHSLKLAEQYPSAKVFISGVHATNSLKTILLKQGKDISVEDFLEQESHHIELDYLSRNTVENGLSTIHYLRSNPEYKSVLIISSDYHILRISLILSSLNDLENAKFYYESIPSNYSEYHNIVKVMKEVIKLAKTVIFLTLWE